MSLLSPQSWGNDQWLCAFVWTLKSGRISKKLSDGSSAIDSPTQCEISLNTILIRTTYLTAKTAALLSLIQLANRVLSVTHAALTMWLNGQTNV